MDTRTCAESIASIAERITQSVHNRTGGTILDLRVSVQEGEVLISGRTSTYYNKQIATHAALSLLQDVRLINNIEVY